MGWPFWDISKVKMSLVHPLSLQGSHLGMTNLLPAPPARVQEASLSFHLRGVPDVAALLLLAPLVSMGAWAPAKPQDLHAAPSESAGEINADQTLPCSCFLGEQPNLHGEYSSFSSEPQPCLLLLGKFSFYPAPFCPHSDSQPSSLISPVLVNLAKPDVLLHPRRGGEGGGRQLLCPRTWWVHGIAEWFGLKGP